MKAIENRNKNSRPVKPVAVQKQYHISIKMATEEYYSLKSKVRLAGMNKSEYIRRCIKSSVVKQRLSAEQLGYIRQLSGIANNINQIARRANTAGYSKVHTHCISTITELDSVIKLIEK